MAGRRRLPPAGAALLLAGHLAQALGGLHLLRTSQYPLATCLDGSPGGYYVYPSPAGASDEDAKKWLIWHMGGGWCSLQAPDAQVLPLDNCLARSSQLLGSSQLWPREFNPSSESWGKEPKFSEDAAENPLMSNWNKVFIPYCDGGSFSGRRQTPATVNGRQLYFRGNFILEAVIDTLLREHKLRDATDVVVGGASAGGLATYLHANQWRQALPKTAFMVIMPEVGFFLDWTASMAPGSALSYGTAIRKAFTDFNATDGVNADCVAARRAFGGNTADCFFAEHVAPYINVPIFALQTVVDPWQVVAELGNQKIDLVNKYRQQVISRLQDYLLTSTTRGGFIDACIQHGFGWQLLKIRGVKQADAFTQWYTAQREAWVQGVEPAEAMTWLQADAFPCDDCCVRDD